MAAECRFTFDGAPVAAAPGQSLAAALTAAGIRAFRTTATGAGRGVFCGMGVCQDCLVTVDGVPNRRACMTPAAAGMAVATQVAFPALDPAAAATAAPPARRIAPDVLVIGGGAAGLAAAAEAARAGAEVVLLDERRLAGGQYYKQPAGEAPALDAQQAAGAALVAEARAAGAELVGEAAIWGAFDGPLFLGEIGGAALVAAPRTAIVATGAYERPALVPGWTLPGVMTTGAAQTLWRSYRTLPGRRVAVAGSGPLNVQVALELARGGAEVALVAEAGPNPLLHPVPAARLLAAGPRLALQGVAMLAALARRGVALRHRSRLVAVEPAGGGLRAIVDGPGGRRAVVVDAVLMNEGFEPQNEILRLLGAAMDHDPAVGHLRCRRSERMETSVPGLYAAGDCAGLGGAPAAVAEGRIAGRAAAAAAGHGDTHDLYAFERARGRARRFQRALWALHDIRPRPAAVLDPAATLCRCEEVTVGAARAAMAAMQPGHAGSLKRLTRVGMGRCQGRYCGPVAARLVSEASGRPLDALSQFAPRVPVKPVTVGAILAAEQAMAAGDAGG
ncbi:MAG: FAD-dependent oxidoreductase [Rhodobacteraceae bacterium]|jgi:thioredoxin reductase|nr:FAD-dependent oxidoreductase [Paracoccaceae bacterium]